MADPNVLNPHPPEFDRFAGLLITTEAMVAQKPEKAGAGSEMPDMGGMGGMM